MSGHRIRELREQKGLSRSDLAEQIGIGGTGSTIRMWETAGKSPSRNNQYKLAEAFNVSVDYLMGYTDIALTRNMSRKKIAVKPTNRIRALRKGRGLTRRELARLLNLEDKLTTVSMWETSNSTPRRNIQAQLASLFNVSIAYLLGYTDTNIIEGIQPPPMKPEEYYDFQQLVAKISDGFLQAGQNSSDYLRVVEEVIDLQTIVFSVPAKLSADPAQSPVAVYRESVRELHHKIDHILQQLEDHVAKRVLAETLDSTRRKT